MCGCLEGLKRKTRGMSSQGCTAQDVVFAQLNGCGQLCEGSGLSGAALPRVAVELGFCLSLICRYSPSVRTKRDAGGNGGISAVFPCC